MRIHHSVIRKAVANSSLTGTLFSIKFLVKDAIETHFLYQIGIKNDLHEGGFHIENYIAFIEKHKNEDLAIKIINLSTLVHMCLNLETDEEFLIECRK